MVSYLLFQKTLRKASGLFLKIMKKLRETIYSILNATIIDENFKKILYCLAHARTKEKFVKESCGYLRLKNHYISIQDIYNLSWSSISLWKWNKTALRWCKISDAKDVTTWSAQNNDEFNDVLMSFFRFGFEIIAI